jgi:hypothetical protein
MRRVVCLFVVFGFCTSCVQLALGIDNSDREVSKGGNWSIRLDSRWYGEATCYAQIGRPDPVFEIRYDDGSLGTMTLLGPFEPSERTVSSDRYADDEPFDPFEFFMPVGVRIGEARWILLGEIPTSGELDIFFEQDLDPALKAEGRMVKAALLDALASGKTVSIHDDRGRTMARFDVKNAAGMKRELLHCAALREREGGP